MTTIIADRRTLTMYADSLCSWGSASFNTHKLVSIGRSIWGVCGDMDNGFKFLEWVRSGGGQDPDLNEDDFSVLELTRRGMYLWGPTVIRLEIHEAVFAIGSGAAYALGAMAAGATPEEAIAIAAHWDTGTRPPVETLKLKSSRRGTP